MATRALPESPLTAADVARGVCRLLHRQGAAVLTEVSLANGRRADVMALCRDGRLIIAEIKVAVGDLKGDRKWPDYLDYCDAFYWAIPAGFNAALLEQDCFAPGSCGLIIGDRFDAAIVRAPAEDKLAAGRRRAATLLFARVAASRLLRATDPFCDEAA